MPRFDGTGPAGQGPGTGWGMGPCGAGRRRGYGGRYGRGYGAGWGFGGGRGRGFGWGGFGNYYSAPALTKKEETEFLSDEAGMLEKELKDIKTRLSELKKQK